MFIEIINNYSEKNFFFMYSMHIREEMKNGM